ncbi:hypothetical protein [Ancylobacter rudongensis]|uniref:Uncharacterized protein n=1 Tax=Ancylobacter rudongensis TaxID=177413 RepID=A0A1G4UQC6_9HYPH|nr:hypothetical protein [Ancylobacter rudongensis]SCW95843.1 hypothetical protein SAMN05660859_0131 [Ancylobacter rudongensis]
MTTAKYEIEVVRKIHDNVGGEHLLVCEDRDGLGLVRIDGQKEFGGEIQIDPHMALELAKAIELCAKEILEKSDDH